MIIQKLQATTVVVLRLRMLATEGWGMTSDDSETVQTFIV